MPLRKKIYDTLKGKVPQAIQDRVPGAVKDVVKETLQPSVDPALLRDRTQPAGPPKPPPEHLNDYGVVDFAVGNRVVAQGVSADGIQATGTSKKGLSRANPDKRTLTPAEAATLPTVPNGAGGTVRGVSGQYLIVALDAEGAGTWEFRKDDWHNLTLPDAGLRYWGVLDVGNESKANYEGGYDDEDISGYDHAGRGSILCGLSATGSAGLRIKTNARRIAVVVKGCDLLLDGSRTRSDRVRTGAGLRALGSVRVSDLERALKRAGFENTRNKGDHRLFKHSDGRLTQIDYGVDPVSKHDLKKILQQTQWSSEELALRLNGEKTGELQQIPVQDLDERTSWIADRVGFSTVARITAEDVFTVTAEFVLTAGRLEDVKAKYSNEAYGPSSSTLIDKMSEADPSKKNKYLMWMADVVFEQNVNYLDVVETVRKYHQLGPKLPKDKRDINKLSLDEVETLIDSLDEEKRGKIKAKMDAKVRAAIAAGAVVVSKTKDWVVLQIGTQEAAHAVGNDAAWCISRQDSEYWHKYRADNDAFYAYVPFYEEGGRYMMQVEGGDAGNITAWDEDDSSHDADSVVPAEAVAAAKADLPKYPEYDGEGAWIEGYAVTSIGSHDVEYFAADRYGLREYMSESAHIQEYGADIHEARITKSDYENGNYEAAELLSYYETVEPEREERFFVQWREADGSKRLLAFDDEEDAREYIDDNEDELEAAGYTLKKGLVSSREISNSSVENWTLHDEETVFEQEAVDVESEKTAPGAVKVYFSTTEGEADIQNMDEDLAGITRDRQGRAQKVFEVELSPRDWRRIQRMDGMPELADLKDARLLEERPEETVTRYVLFGDGNFRTAVPAWETDQTTAAQQLLDDSVKAKPWLKWELREIEVPKPYASETGDDALLKGAISSKTIEKHDGTIPWSTTLRERNVTKEDLGLLPNGSILTANNTAYVKVGKNSWKDRQGNKLKTDRLFSYSAYLYASITFPGASGEIPSLFGKSKSESGDESKSFSVRDLYVLPQGSRIQIVDGDGDIYTKDGMSWVSAATGEDFTATRLLGVSNVDTKVPVKLLSEAAAPAEPALAENDVKVQIQRANALEALPTGSKIKVTTGGQTYTKLHLSWWSSDTTQRRVNTDQLAALDFSIVHEAPAPATDNPAQLRMPFASRGAQ